MCFLFQLFVNNVRLSVARPVSFLEAYKNVRVNRATQPAPQQPNREQVAAISDIAQKSATSEKGQKVLAERVLTQVAGKLLGSEKGQKLVAKRLLEALRDRLSM